MTPPSASGVFMASGPYYAVRAHENETEDRLGAESSFLAVRISSPTT